MEKLKQLFKANREKFLVAFVGILVVVILLLMQRMGTLRDRVTLLSNKNDSSFTAAKFYKDHNGQLTAQIQVQQLTISDLKALSSQLGIEKERLKGQVGNLSNLVSYFKAEAQAKGSSGSIKAKDTILTYDKTLLANADTTRHDSVVVKEFEWSNKFLTTNSQYFPKTDEFAFDYLYDPGNIEVTSYYKKVSPGLFKKKELVGDLRFEDPNMRVTKFEAISIKQEKKKFWQTQWFAAVVGFVLGTVSK